jgi:hypothetical protein
VSYGKDVRFALGRSEKVKKQRTDEEPEAGEMATSRGQKTMLVELGLLLTIFSLESCTGELQISEG